MVTLIFKFDPRKGQLQVKLGQIRSNFKIRNFLTKIYLSCADLSQDSKNVIYFYVRQLEMPKNAFQKCDVITFTCFLAIAQAKTKILLWNFVCVLFVCIPIIYSGFFKNFPRFGKYLNKSNFLVEKSQDLEIFSFWKFRDGSFLCQAFLYLLPYF